MRLTSGGNLLLGTTTDSGGKLNIKGNLFFQQDSYSDNTTIGFGNPARNGDAAFITYDGNGDFRGSILFGTVTTASNVAASEVMRISKSGNLLIGTTTDSGEKLQVNGNIKVGDSNHLFIGSSSDLDLYHTGTNSFVENWTGDLYIRNNSADKDIIFQNDDGSGGITEYFRLDGSQASSNYYYTKFPDKSSIVFGDSYDLRIYHDSNDSSIENETGNLYIQQKANDKDIIFRCDNGSGGVAEYITLDGSQTTVNLHQSVLIGTTTNSGVYKLDVFGKARVQSVFELDDVLTLNQISTPADPQSGQSSIYMDSADGAIKCKINVGGTVVTRTIASFE
jgi:hypothetical protein